ncbi:LytTR family two component transcriptional regulator [Arcicella aurantiaca]|uniref:LytTR family two component transcriptional regulator n=2 Tax=Arcicella aurantiaca TaxID=591202 RepID=A0A316EFN9_9BACT|nr:LytTR family transcriptional regulator DNA-binding domain-containing protein [Arcicella aurantiaca]PWK28513.1 LytTR family two component transcriptional regulator [Arcicella aurantiaca]
MFKTILIDDEKLAISRLERLLGKYTDTFEIIGRANNGAEGLSMVESLRPDLIFLDIEMPVMTGFEMLAHLKHLPLVVFATAYDEYAIKAFEENSIDYLLKPIENERLEKTVQKLNLWKSAQENQTKSPFDENILKMIEAMRPKKAISSISVKTGNKILLIDLQDISHFEAEDKYVFLVTLDGNKYLTSYTISILSEKLPDTQFLQISRANIINTQKIKEIEKHFNGKYQITMKDKAQSKMISGGTFGDAIKELFEI